MKILALDSSGIVASVAVVEDDTLLAEYTVNYKKTHSQTLLPMLDEIVPGPPITMATAMNWMPSRLPWDRDPLQDSVSARQQPKAWDLP